MSTPIVPAQPAALVPIAQAVAAKPPPADDYAEEDQIKMLFLGDSGSGKTGALAALAAIGYNLWIADLDKGAQILKGPKGYLKHPDSIYLKPRPGLWTAQNVIGVFDRVHAVPLDETMQNIQGRAIPKGDAWGKLLKLLSDWQYRDQKKGPLETWTNRDILVLDSLSRASTAALNQQLVMAGRAIKGPEQQDWWPAQNQVERLLGSLVTSQVKCHVIVIAHIKYIESDNSITRGMPQTLGKALSPQIGQYFNHMVMAKATGQGVSAKYKLVTRTTGMIDLKSSAPLAVKPEYDLETGLAEYFLSTVGPLSTNSPA